MIDLFQQFLLISIIIYCVHMIYYYFRKKSKKYKNIPTIEMNFLVNIYQVDILKIGLSVVEKHIAFINSIIVSTDLLVYYNISNSIFKLIVVFIITFLLVFIFYSILGIIYRRMLR